MNVKLLPMIAMIVLGVGASYWTFEATKLQLQQRHSNNEAREISKSACQINCALYAADHGRFSLHSIALLGFSVVINVPIRARDDC